MAEPIGGPTGIAIGATSPSPETLTITGQIILADASPFVGSTVRAFDKNLRAEMLLGETKSDAGGEYTITYTLQKLGRPDKQNADLVVRVFDALGKQLGASDVLFNAPAEATIDV